RQARIGDPFPIQVHVEGEGLDRLLGRRGSRQEQRERERAAERTKAHRLLRSGGMDGYGRFRVWCGESCVDAMQDAPRSTALSSDRCLRGDVGSDPFDVSEDLECE